MDIKFSNDRMIDVEAQLEGNKVFITFLYGDPVVEYRENVWERLLRMSANRTGAWLLMGDFNEITSNAEKKGGRKRPESSFLPFKNMLAGCGMIEFPAKGNTFSWAGRMRAGRVQCRLDRAVGNEDWHSLFSHTYVEYLLRWGSDHRPILAHFQARDIQGRRNFRFDQNWFSKEGFTETVKGEWEALKLEPDLELYDKICRTRKSISRWKRRNPFNNAKLIESLKQKLDQAQNDDMISSEQELELKWKLCAAYREEELYWKQKSRVLWLREGDRNTKYFHAKTKQRRARNRITRLQNAMNQWVCRDEEIEAVASNYFQELFATTNPDTIQESIRFITAKVTNEMNQHLLSIPRHEEIKEATFAINPEKAPGPDGMTSLFYKHFWSSVGKDVCDMVRNFFETGDLDERLNRTNICLIPKTDRPEAMAEFRPISLCNVGYKIISKILSSRLKRILPKIISETQSAFMAERLITDNILVAQEMFHALCTNPSCKGKFVAIKTDMSKAYDRVE